MAAPIVTITLNPCIDKSFAVDRVVPERKLMAKEVHLDPGGGGINVARVAQRLGARVHAIWSCGGDTGRRLSTLLDAEHIDHSSVGIDNDIRENLIAFDESSGEQYRFGMPGPSLSGHEQALWVDRVQEIAPDTQYVVVSGSVPGRTSGEWFEQLLRSLPSRARVIVDAKNETLRRALSVGVFLIKPNVHELEELTGNEMRSDREIAHAARDLIVRGGATIVIVSLGRAGAFLVTASDSQHITAPPVPPRSKVGAGDSMVGGLVTALEKGHSLEEAIQLGVAAGTAAVMTEGTELCRRTDTERLLKAVRIHDFS